VSNLRSGVESLGIGASSGASSKAGSTIDSEGASAKGSVAGTPKVGIAHERIVEEFRRKEREGKLELSLVVIGEFCVKSV